MQQLKTKTEQHIDSWLKKANFFEHAEWCIKCAPIRTQRLALKNVRGGELHG